jgi:hypothetical protein
MKMKAPEGATSVHHDGETFDVEADGTITVTQEAGQALLGHGYVEIPRDEGVTEDDAAMQAEVKAKNKGGRPRKDAAVEGAAE